MNNTTAALAAARARAALDNARAALTAAALALVNSANKETPALAPALDRAAAALTAAAAALPPARRAGNRIYSAIAAAAPPRPV